MAATSYWAVSFRMLSFSLGYLASLGLHAQNIPDWNSADLLLKDRNSSVICSHSFHSKPLGAHSSCCFAYIKKVHGDFCSACHYEESTGGKVVGCDLSPWETAHLDWPVHLGSFESEWFTLVWYRFIQPNAYSCWIYTSEISLSRLSRTRQHFALICIKTDNFPKW